MKECRNCHEVKPLDEFVRDKNKRDGRRSQCRECHNKQIRSYYHNGGGREEQGHQSIYKNKKCSGYIGIIAAERLIKHLFNDVIMMPYGYPGYDMICNKGKKINVKASTIHVRENKNTIVNYWEFRIGYNKVPDYFLCMAFDNVDDINPLMMWMIPGNEINHMSGTRISSTTIHKWDKWKMNITDAQACCNLMKRK